ncbi:hypothetical protein [Streptomyces platensis]|uniref:hypothetical protein n=1 Tax=Streptomyces platensis TaxID=58346 RepID=UPI00331BD340
MTDSAIEPGQEYAACDRSGYRYQVDAYPPGALYVQVTDLGNGHRKKVKPSVLHADPTRRTGYLLAELVDAEWEKDPRTSTAIYRAQLDRIDRRATEK